MITIDQSDHIIKVCKSYFKGRIPPKCDIPFRTNGKVEDEYVAAIPATAPELLKLEK